MGCAFLLFFVLFLFTKTRVPTQFILVIIQLYWHLYGFFIWIVSSVCERWVGYENVSLNSNYHTIGLASSILKWVRFILVYLVVMWRWWYLYWWVISLGSQYGNIVDHSSGSWGICLLTFVLIHQNCKGIWNLIQHIHVGLEIQPCVVQ